MKDLSTIPDSSEGAMKRLRRLFASGWDGRVVLEVRGGGVKWLSTEEVTQGSELASESQGCRAS